MPKITMKRLAIIPPQRFEKGETYDVPPSIAAKLERVNKHAVIETAAAVPPAKKAVKRAVKAAPAK